MPRLFGTQGFRGRVPDELTSELAHDIGFALAREIGPQKTIGLGWDTRVTSEMLSLAVSAGLMKGGCNIYLLGLVPTPLLSYAIPQLDLDGGVMITASHNPPEFNGIKLWEADGAPYTPEREEVIERNYFSSDKPQTAWEDCGALLPTEDLRAPYIKDLVNQIDEPRLQKKQFRIVADCGGGTAFTIIPVLFQLLEVKTELLFCEPDGFFKNRMPEPVENNLTRLIQRVKDADVDIGIAWDCDADRVVFISETGRYLMGDRVFALAAYYWLRDLNEEPKQIVTQVATSDVIRDVAQMVEAEVTLTAVGEPRIVSKMKEVNAPIGGEENGGVIYRGWSWTREGLLTALVILDLMASEDKSLEELDCQFPMYHQEKEKVFCPGAHKKPLLNYIKTIVPQDVECGTLDGIKLRYSDGWLLLRPSGTEPVFRVFAEAKTKNRAKSLINQGLKLVTEALEEIKISAKIGD